VGWKNKLFFGDNLEILRQHVVDESVDIIYLDPPFNSKADYNVLYRERDGTRSRAQLHAFEDTWHWDNKAQSTYEDVVKSGPRKLTDLIVALQQFLGHNDMMAYLVMMSVRLVEMHRVLKPTGSLYLHCDPTASHYIKLLLDAVFGQDQFRNEVVWRRTGTHNKIRRYAPIHDVIFFYTKTNKYKWGCPKRPYMVGHVNQHFVLDTRGYRTNYYGNVLTGSGVRNGESGRAWRGFNPTARGRHWAIPGVLLEDIDEDLSHLGQHAKLDKLFDLGFIKIVPGHTWPIYERYLRATDGQPLTDIWAYQPYTNGTVFGTHEGIDEDVRWLSPQDQERLGYPTQKPEALLERIINASSEPGDLVLDPFCGCGTTISVAEKLGRRWIGIDVTHLAINLIKSRLNKTFKDNLSEYVEGSSPRDVEGARQLACKNRYEFEYWVLGLIQAQPVKDKRKGADGGVDGYIHFFDKDSKRPNKIVVQVKSGHVGVAHIRDLKGVLAREKAVMGALITLEPPTKPMVHEALGAGFYNHPHVPGLRFPVIQVLTVEEILKGGQLAYANTYHTYRG